MSGEKFQAFPGIMLTFVGISVTLNSDNHLTLNLAEFQCCFKL